MGGSVGGVDISAFRTSVLVGVSCCPGTGDRWAGMRCPWRACPPGQPGQRGGSATGSTNRRRCAASSALTPVIVSRPAVRLRTHSSGFWPRRMAGYCHSQLDSHLDGVDRPRRHAGQALDTQHHTEPEYRGMTPHTGRHARWLTIQCRVCARSQERSNYGGYPGPPVASTEGHYAGDGERAAVLAHRWIRARSRRHGHPARRSSRPYMQNRRSRSLSPDAPRFEVSLGVTARDVFARQEDRTCLGFDLFCQGEHPADGATRGRMWQVARQLDNGGVRSSTESPKIASSR